MSDIYNIDANTAPHRVRRAIRDGHYCKPTNGIASNYVQCNIAILPKQYAEDFSLYCELNSQACPVLARSEPGDPSLSALGIDIDIRTDLPGYTVIRNGKATQTVGDILDLWRDDFVTFAFGCSFSFEQALINEGVNLRYLSRGEGPALFVSNIDTRPVGKFSGKLAVSMRPLRPADAIKAIIVTAQYPNAHGAPVHIGKAEMIGITDLQKPLQSIGHTRVLSDELPVFWACGVTTQLVLQGAQLPLCITHASAHMLVTDIPLQDLKSTVSLAP